jgi:hypothetical protein|tara:strand:+ start:71 stop:664 length:594 start_codon:yes stop_codon:yes gene_type:complete
MANRNTAGFGLIAQGTVGSTPATQGQGKYYIDAAYDKSLYQGTAVQSKVGYIKVGQNAITDKTIGILNGIFYNAATTLKPTFANHYAQPITPANSEDITAFVIDNPLQLFVASVDAAVTQANYGKTYGLTTGDPGGSTTSGQSSAEVIVAGVSATANSWRLIRTAEDPENNDITAANCSVIVCQNLNQYLTNAVTWQ